MNEMGRCSQNPSPLGGKVTQPSVPNQMGPERGESGKPAPKNVFNKKLGNSEGVGAVLKQRKGYGETQGREMVGGKEKG